MDINIHILPLHDIDVANGKNMEHTVEEEL